MTLIDTHFHLDKYSNHGMLFKNINTLRQYTLCMTCSPGVYLSCKELYPETKYVQFALGMHPMEIREANRCIYEFDHCFSQAKYIGEVGLDYSKGAPPKTEQFKVFRHIIKKQADTGKVISLHIRRADDDAIGVLSQFPSKNRIVHWFTGNQVQLNKFLDIGCYFSINAAMVQKAEQRGMLKSIPINRLLIESDGPYSKLENKRYIPNSLGRIYMTVGNALGIPNIEKIIYDNFAFILNET